MPELSFFSEKPLKIGQIIKVKFGRRYVPAFVSKSEQALTQKQNLRRVPYRLKALDAELSNVVMTKSFLSLTSLLAEELQTEIGHIIELVLPRFDILKALGTSSIDIESAKSEHPCVRIICLPNPFFAEQVAMELEGAAHEAILIHPKLSTKEAVRRLKNVLGGGCDQVVLTPQYLSLLGSLASQITVARAGENYRSMSTPAIDLRSYIEKYAEAAKIELHYEDVLVPVDKALATNAFAKSKISGQSSKPEISLIDTKEPGVLGNKTRGGLAKQTVELVDKTLGEHGKLLIVCARKSLAPLSICRDCGSAVLCQSCDASLQLRRMGGLNKYYCYKCSRQESAERICENCGSWNIRPLGTGVEKVSTAISELWPTAKRIVISRDTQSSMASAAKVLDGKLAETDIVIAIDSMVPYLSSSFDRVLVLGADTLLALPNHNARERLYRHLVMLRGLARKSLMIQSRSPGATLYRLFSEGQDDEFIQQELTERERFGYPPYTVLIKISKAKAPPKVIKVPISLWPNYKLDANLGSITDPKTVIEINPQSIS